MPAISIPPELGRALMGLADEESNPPPPRPIVEAQRDELRQRFAAYSTDHEFRPGMLVREKPGLGTLREDAEYAIMFWRWLDFTNPLDLQMAKRHQRRVNGNRADCVTVIVIYAGDGTGSGLRYSACDSKILEPDSEA